MFFWLSKTLGPLLFPLPLFLLAAVLLLTFARRWKRWRMLFAMVLAFFYILTTPACSNWLIRSYEIKHNEAQLTKPHYDVAIVLAGIVNLEASNDSYIEFGAGANRILVAIALVKKGMVDQLLISGGSGDPFQQQIREADLLKRFAISAGVPPERILTERDSRNTYENARNCKDILTRIHARNLLLITSAFHMRRSLACFHKLDVRPDILSVDYMGKNGVNILDFIPSAAALNTTTIFIKEAIGLIGYKIKGYI